MISEAQFSELRSEIAKQGTGNFPIVSGSMEPVIMTGDWITVVPISGPLKRYDILVYWNSKILVCHYLWHKNQYPGADGLPIYVTRALRSKYDDFPISEKHILGLVTSHRISFSHKLKIILRTLIRARRG